MKQKRTFIAILLVIAILGLGIAYAEIKDDVLTATGTAVVTPDDNAFDVVFLEGATCTGHITAATVDPTNDQKVTLTLNAFTAKEQTGKAVIKVKNNSDEYKATLALEGTESNTNFTVSSELAATELAAGAETTLTIDVTALKAVTTEATLPLEFTITAKPVAQ